MRLNVLPKRLSATRFMMVHTHLILLHFIFGSDNKRIRMLRDDTGGRLQFVGGKFIERTQTVAK